MGRRIVFEIMYQIAAGLSDKFIQFMNCDTSDTHTCRLVLSRISLDGAHMPMPHQPDIIRTYTYPALKMYTMIHV